MIDATLVYSGGEVKALGSGRVGGYVVRFGDPDTADVQGDFFTQSTYLGTAVKSGVDVVYHHGLGRVDALADRLKNSIIGEAKLSMKADGWWAEASVTEPEVYALADAGKLGWSSGSVERLVKRTPIKGTITRIDQWPLVEVSLSPRPVDPRNKAISIKSLITPEGPATGSLMDRAEALVADVEAVVAAFRDQAQHRASEGRAMSAVKREAVKSMRDALDGLIEASTPRPTPEQVQQALRLRAEYLRG